MSKSVSADMPKNGSKWIVIGTVVLTLVLAGAAVVALGLSLPGSTSVASRITQYAGISTQVGMLVVTIAYFAATYALLLATRSATLENSMMARRVQIDSRMPSVAFKDISCEVSLGSKERPELVIHEIEHEQDSGSGKMVVNRRRGAVLENDLCLRLQLAISYVGEAGRGGEMSGRIDVVHSTGVYSFDLMSQQFVSSGAAEFVRWTAECGVSRVWEQTSLNEAGEMT
jgi:hypothetical protein